MFSNIWAQLTKRVDYKSTPTVHFIQGHVKYVVYNSVPILLSTEMEHMSHFISTSYTAICVYVGTRPNSVSCNIEDCAMAA